MFGRGQRYEKFVYEAIAAELAYKRLGLIPEYCRIFAGKGYYSRDRKAKIRTDISIELTLPGQSEWSLLVVIECKEYSGPVKVDELEEFYAKIRQIVGANVKAIFVTSSHLQRGALNYAKSKGIAVIRLLRWEEVNWIVASGCGDNTPINSKLLERGFFDQSYVPTNRDFFACNGRRMFDSWEKLLLHYLKEQETKQCFLSRVQRKEYRNEECWPTNEIRRQRREEFHTTRADN